MPMRVQNNIRDMITHSSTKPWILKVLHNYTLKNEQNLAFFGGIKNGLCCVIIMVSQCIWYFLCNLTVFSCGTRGGSQVIVTVWNTLGSLIVCMHTSRQEHCLQTNFYQKWLICFVIVSLILLLMQKKILHLLFASNCLKTNRNLDKN